ncbi:MAG TPA: glycosyltransferase family 2 protein [Bryobacteraceae bacterium]|jgi:cellulose synthase/poly-beta-1,6-N-acetylglucosamine synthase-like glycosyltransferase
MAAAPIGLLMSAGAVAYILIGYPLLLALWRNRRLPPVAKDPAFKTHVTVIMAVYSGAAFLSKKLESILSLDYPKELMQILVVSDGSTDATEDIAREYAAQGVELIAAPHAGKAACLNLAFERATGDLLFLTDVRQLLDSQALSNLVSDFADPTVGAATGEMRLLPGSSGEHRDMDLYWRYELWARRRHSEIDSLFTTTGCLYALRRELAAPLPTDTLSDDAYLALKAFSRGYRVIFDPEAIAFDYPAIAGTEFRRRWRNLAGLWQIHWRTPWLFTSANRMRLHFLSHKFGRLVLPWAMLAVVAFTAMLPDVHRRNSLLAVDAVFAALALLDRWIPLGFPLKRLSSPIRTFLLMNAASLAAIAIFLIPAQKLWKPTRAAAP